MRSRLKALLKRTEAGTEDVKELVREISPLPCVYKQRLYSAAAWSTGLTFDEIGALDSEIRLENRRVI